MAYSGLGYSLPDLTVTGTAGNVAAWGGSLSLALDVRNIGASSMIEPLNLTPDATSTADAPATTVTVIAKPRGNSRHAGVVLGNIAIPAVDQNDAARVDATLTLPSRPAGFPGSGGRIDLLFVVNPNRTFVENDYTNNIGKAANPVLIEAGLPDLQTTELDVPPTLNPGDYIQPNIRLANFGTVNSSPQGPILVQLIASLDKNFGPGDVVVASYTFDGLSPLSIQPSGKLILNDSNLDPGANVTTIQGQPVALPPGPASYYLGVIVDPNNTIKELHEVGRGPSFRLQQLRRVGPNVSGLPPAGVTGTFNPTVVPLFPYTGVTTTGAGTTITVSGIANGSVSASNTKVATPNVTAGGAQARTLRNLRNRPSTTLVNQPLLTAPSATPGFVTGQIGSSEQTGSFLFPQIIHVPTSTVFQTGITTVSAGNGKK